MPYNVARRDAFGAPAACGRRRALYTRLSAGILPRVTLMPDAFLLFALALPLLMVTALSPPLPTLARAATILPSAAGVDVSA